MCGDQKDPLDRLQNGKQARQKQEKVLDKIQNRIVKNLRKLGIERGK